MAYHRKSHWPFPINSLINSNKKGVYEGLAIPAYQRSTNVSQIAIVLMSRPIQNMTSSQNDVFSFVLKMFEVEERVTKTNFANVDVFVNVSDSICVLV